MTDPTDAKLAALTLLEAGWNKNDENRRAITSTTTDLDIVLGLLGIAAMGVGQIAGIYNITVNDVIQSFRAALLVEQAGVS